MKPLLILGSGTFAIETLDIAEAEGGYKLFGFVNSLEKPITGTLIEGFPVFWIDDLPFKPNDCLLVTGIISNRRRGFVETMVDRGFRFTSVIHPSAAISRRAKIGVGCVVNANVVVSSNTVIEDHVILNRAASIGHDNRISAYSTIGPGATIAGAIEIGVGSYIGVGAVIRDHLTIGSESVVGAGAVVVKNVPSNVTVMGLPARITQKGIKGL